MYLKNNFSVYKNKAQYKEGACKDQSDQIVHDQVGQFH